MHGKRTMPGPVRLEYILAGIGLLRIAASHASEKPCSPHSSGLADNPSRRLCNHGASRKLGLHLIVLNKNFGDHSWGSSVFCDFHASFATIVQSFAAIVDICTCATLYFILPLDSSKLRLTATCFVSTSPLRRSMDQRWKIEAAMCHH